MQKKIIALAVAGLMSGTAFAQSNVTISGAVRASLDHTNAKAAQKDAWTLTDRASRLNLKGSEDLGGGMKAIWQWESQLNTTMSATAGTTQRNTFVGLQGGFGTVLMGAHDTPYKLGGSADLFGDTGGDAQCSTAAATFATNVACIIGRNGFDNRAAKTVAYISPTWSGFHFGAAVIPGEEAGGTTANNDANGLADSYSVVAVYENGPLKATLGHEKFGADTQSTTATGMAARSATKVNIKYTMGAIGLGYTNERSSDLGAAATHTKDTGNLLSVSYAMGATTLGLQYGKFNDKDATATDLKTTTIGAYHNLSKRTQAYAAYHIGSFGTGGENNDAKVFTMGLNHSF